MPQSNRDILPWSDPTPDRRRFAARLQKAQAAVLFHADDAIGCILRAFEATSQKDGTMIVAMSRNGPARGRRRRHASRPRARPPRARGRRRTHGGLGPRRPEGGVRLSSPGWTQASNVALEWHEKGTHRRRGTLAPDRPLPKGLGGEAGSRRYFHHAVDLAPAVLEVADIAPPYRFAVVTRMPSDGAFLRYSVTAPDAWTSRRTQYFELLGDPAL